MTPKKTAVAATHRGALWSKHRFQIHRVTKMSPATMCAQVAAAPGLLPMITAKPSRMPLGSVASLARSAKACGFAMVTNHHTMSGPRKNHGPWRAFLVSSCSGKISMANQNGPTHIVEKKNDTSYKSTNSPSALAV